jgi:Anaphase-promoting complex, cyclosome, subunit 3
LKKLFHFDKMGAPIAAAGATPYHATPLGIHGRHGHHTGDNSSHNPAAPNTTTQPPESLEATYTSLIQEYLQVMCLENATFLAERMVASCKSINAHYLLAVCHYRSNAPQRALSVLEHNSAFLKEHPPTAYLMAQCSFQLKQYGRAEEVLLQTARSDYREYKANYINNHAAQGDDRGAPMTMDEWMVETSPCPVPNGAVGLYLLGNVCRRSNRKRRAMEYYRMSLQVRKIKYLTTCTVLYLSLLC